MDINIKALKRFTGNFKPSRKQMIIIGAVALMAIGFLVFSYKATMFVGGIVSTAFSGENMVDVEKHLPGVLGKKSTNYQGCGFPGLKWGMSLDEVKKALPEEVLTLSRDRSNDTQEVYETKNGVSLVFKNGKLFATSKFFPFSGNGSNLISQALETFGRFEQDDHFETFMETEMSTMRQRNTRETVLYNFGDTQVAVIIAVQDGSNQRTFKSLLLSFIDTKAVQEALKEYVAYVVPQVSWTTSLVAGIEQDGKLADFTTIPPQMVIEYVQHTPELHRGFTEGEPKPEEAMDTWRFRNDRDKENERAALTLEIDRARNDRYKDLPQGTARGTLFLGKVDMPKIPPYLRDNIHLELLYLRMNDIILQSIIDNAKVTHYLQDKLMIKKVYNTPVRTVPYSRFELPNGYVFELPHTNEIRFFKAPPGEKIM